MTRDEIEALVKSRDRAWAERNADALAAHYAENAIVESPTHGTLKNRAAIRSIFATWLDAFPDVTFRQTDLIVEGDRAAVFFTVAGTHIKPFAAIPATGRHVEIDGVLLMRFEDGLIVHEKRFYDSTSLLVQIGVLKAKPM